MKVQRTNETLQAILNPPKMDKKVGDRKRKARHIDGTKSPKKAQQGKDKSQMDRLNKYITTL